MYVSPYDASLTTQRNKLRDLAALVSGPDRDLMGQFGSFATIASLLTSASALVFNADNQFEIIPWLQDTGTFSVTASGTLSTGFATITGLPSTVLQSLEPGFQVTGTGVPASTTVLTVIAGVVTMSHNATATGAESLTFTNPNPGAQDVGVVAAASAGVIMGTAFPYLPLDNAQIGGLLPPVLSSDRIAVGPTELSENALVAGLTPIRVDASGNVRFVRTRTTRVTTDGSTPATAYFDWQDLVTLNDFREDVFNRLQAPDLKPKKASITTAKLVKDEVIRIAKAYEDAEAFQSVAALAPQFIVQPSTSSRGRFDFQIPVNVVPGLHVIAGNIQATTAFDAFTL